MNLRYNAIENKFYQNDLTFGRNKMVLKNQNEMNFKCLMETKITLSKLKIEFNVPKKSELKIAHQILILNAKTGCGCRDTNELFIPISGTATLNGLKQKTSIQENVLGKNNHWTLRERDISHANLTKNDLLQKCVSTPASSHIVIQGAFLLKILSHIC